MNYYLNTNESLIRENGRKAITMTAEELKANFNKALGKLLQENDYSEEEIEEIINELWSVDFNSFGFSIAEYIDMNAQLMEDLSDIEFTNGMFWFEKPEDLDKLPEEHREEAMSNLTGLHTLENGFSFIGCYGSDGEGYENTATFAIIYHDGEKLRAYQPLCGNLYNADTKASLGHNREDEDNEQDAKFLRKELNNPNISYSELVYFQGNDELNYNWDLIKKDILSYFEIVK